MISKPISVADYLRLDQDEEDPLASVDCIMRFERSADDFRNVSGELGIPAAALPRYNRSTGEHYSKDYDEELRELAGSAFVWRSNFSTERKLPLYLKPRTARRVAYTRLRRKIRHPAID